MTTLIIAGSRNIYDYHALAKLVRRVSNDQLISKVISGGANGVDSMAKKVAAEFLGVPFEVYLPEYDLHGRRAPLIRNTEMARDGSYLAALWDGISRGTSHMILEAHRHGLAVYVEVIAKE